MYSVALFEVQKQKNRTNHLISNNSHPSATANKSQALETVRSQQVEQICGSSPDVNEVKTSSDVLVPLSGELDT